MTKTQRKTVMALLNAIDRDNKAHEPVVMKLGELERKQPAIDAERRAARLALETAIRETRLLMGMV